VRTTPTVPSTGTLSTPVPSRPTQAPSEPQPSPLYEDR
jgi:hypothetical protein